MARKGLGKGLDSLIPNFYDEDFDSNSTQSLEDMLNDVSEEEPTEEVEVQEEETVEVEIEDEGSDDEEEETGEGDGSSEDLSGDSSSEETVQTSQEVPEIRVNMAHVDEVKEIVNKINEADVIVAPIADNRMFDLISEFVDGVITNEQCEHALAASNLGSQYVIKTKKGLDNLKYIKLFYLSNKEKEEYKDKRLENNNINLNIADSSESEPTKSAISKKKKRSSDPTLEEINKYIAENGLHVDGEYFYHFYAALNWMQGHTKIRDWREKLLSWDKSNKVSKDNKTRKAADKNSFQQNEYDYEALERELRAN